MPEIRIRLNEQEKKEIMSNINLSKKYLKEFNSSDNNSILKVGLLGISKYIEEKIKQNK